MAGAGAELAGAAMTDLDRRVAELRGWTVLEHRGAFASPDEDVVRPYSPSTNITDAIALWEEARPDGWSLEILQDLVTLDRWQVGRRRPGIEYHAVFVPFTDLPRAITQAWVEAKEGK